MSFFGSIGGFLKDAAGAIAPLAVGAASAGLSGIPVVGGLASNLLSSGVSGLMGSSPNIPGSAHSFSGSPTDVGNMNSGLLNLTQGATNAYFDLAQNNEVPPVPTDTRTMSEKVTDWITKSTKFSGKDVVEARVASVQQAAGIDTTNSAPENTGSVDKSAKVAGVENPGLVLGTVGITVVGGLAGLYAIISKALKK